MFESIREQSAKLSPRSTNLSAFKHSFGHADQETNVKDELSYLKEIDEAGTADEEVALYYLSDGATYDADHGTERCKAETCLDPDIPPEGIPNNCGFHHLWINPWDFEACGKMCKGAFCQCLRSYPIRNFSDFYEYDSMGKVMMIKGSHFF